MKDMKQVLALLVVAVFCVGIASGAKDKDLQKKAPGDQGYVKEQIKIFNDINALKNAGYSKKEAEDIANGKKGIDVKTALENAKRPGFKTAEETTPKPETKAPAQQPVTAAKAEAQTTEQKPGFFKKYFGFTKITLPGGDTRATAIKRGEKLGSDPVKAAEQAKKEKTFAAEISPKIKTVSQDLNNLDKSSPAKLGAAVKAVAKSVDTFVKTTEKTKDKTPKMFDAIIKLFKAIAKRIDNAIAKLPIGSAQKKILLSTKFKSEKALIDAAIGKITVLGSEIGERTADEPLKTAEYLTNLTIYIKAANEITGNRAYNQLDAKSKKDIDTVKAEKESYAKNIAGALSEAKSQLETVRKQQADADSLVAVPGGPITRPRDEKAYTEAYGKVLALEKAIADVEGAMGRPASTAPKNFEGNVTEIPK